MDHTAFSLRKDGGKLHILVREYLRSLSSHPSILCALHTGQDSRQGASDGRLFGHVQNGGRTPIIIVIVIATRHCDCLTDYLAS
jgi:hypothetical protein